MSRYADPDRCPDCRAPLPAHPAPRAVCPACGLPLAGPAAAELFTTLQRADELVASLRAGTAAAPLATSAATVAVPPPVLPVPPGPTVRVPPLQPAAPRPARHWTVPGVLLSLGGLCLVVGALVFLAVTWSVLGVGGRTAVLVGLTVVAAVGAWSGARRGLRAAAETFAAVGGLFLALDLAGAASAGWLGDLGPASSTLVGALVVVVVPTAGNLALRRCPTGALLAPQLVAVGAAVVAAGAALVRFEAHPTLVTATAIVVAAALAYAVRKVGQPALAVGSVVLGVLLWMLLVITGLSSSLEAWAEDGLGAATWQDVEPLLVAAGFAGAVLLGCRLARAAAAVQQVAAVVACWLVPTAVAAVLGGTVTAIVLVAVASAAVVLVLALVARSLRAALGLAALGLGAAAALGAASPLLLLATGVAEEVVRQLQADHQDLLAHADLATVDGDVAAPWTVPLAAAVLAGALLVLLHRRVGAASWRPVLAIGVPVLAGTLLCYVPFLLAVVGAAVLAAALQLVPQVRPWRPVVAWPLAAGWMVVAGAVAVYDPLPATLVAALAAVTAVVQVVRSGSLVGQVLAPPLVGATVAAGGWLASAPGTWVAAAVIVAIAVLATLLGSVEFLGTAALFTFLVPLVAGTEAASGTADGWLTAYLSLAAAGAAAVAIRHRSREAAWTGAALGLAATWVRLAGVGVETPEAYTLPLAAVLLGFGGWSWRHEPRLGSMRTLGPGLAAALVPSLVVTMHDPVSLRALLLALACGALVAMGAAWRLRGPFVSGAVAGAALVVMEVVPFHDAVPRWVLLTVAGICLVVAGVRWEHLATLGRRGWGRLHDLA